MTREEAKEAVKEAYGNSEYTDEIIQALEQEPILDKIRDEIEFKSRIVLKDTPNDDWSVKWNECIKEVLEVIDKFKVESEVK